MGLKQTAARMVVVTGSFLSLFIGSKNDAHATDETAAVYIQGMGGSLAGTSNPSVGGFGVEAGAQLLFLEAYANHTVYGGDSAVNRLVLGPFFDINWGKWELSLHLGLGAISDPHGVLRNDGATSQSGGIARIGLGFERDLGSFFVAGVTLNSEAFSTKNENDSIDSSWHSGSSVLLSGHLKFELGI